MLSLKNRKAVSPVIATVILVAIAITVAVAVAFWIGGITGQYTRFEKLEISTAYCEANATDGWDVTLDLRNTGTIESSIINALVNGKKIGDYATPITAKGETNATVVDPLDFANGVKMVLPAGQSGKVVIHVPSTAASFTSGTTIECSLLSSAGNSYMKMVTLS